MIALHLGWKRSSSTRVRAPTQAPRSHTGGFNKCDEPSKHPMPIASGSESIRFSRRLKGRAKGSGAVTSLPCFLVMMPKTSLVPLTPVMQPSRETRDTIGRQSHWQLYNSITMCDTPTSLTFTAGFSHIRRPQAARDAALNTNSRPGAPLAPYPSFTIDTNHC